jgi:RHS repeat-associated protein
LRPRGAGGRLRGGRGLTGGARALSTAHHQYTLRKLYTGLDGREVRVAFESASDSWGYDTAPFAAASSSPTIADVVLDQVAGPEPSTPAPLKVRATAGTAHTQGSSVVDLFGNASSSVASGCVDGAACATPDDVITSRTVPELVIGDTSGWLWRTVETNVQGESDPAPRKDTFTAYDVNGNPVHSYALLSGTLALDRFHELPSASIAATPATASADGQIDLSWQTYDAFGNVTWSAAPNSRCRQVTYASDYDDLATSETTFVGAATGSCGAGPGGAGGTTVTAYAGYDRGLSAPVSTIDLHGELTRVAFDDLGRLTTMWKPSPTQIGATSPQPSVLVDYDLATASRPYSIVHTKTQDGADDTVVSYREAFGFVDGFGRPLLGFEQADPAAGDAAPWILSGLTVRDEKGATQYAYLASFSNGSDPRTYPIAQPATTASERQRYDAFGRQVQTFALDGTVILQSAYHALSVDKWDAADLAPGPHQGTYASAAQDGHGRAVSMTERIHAGAQLEARTTTTQFMSTGEPRVITRHRGADQVTRWLQYDSLGRMVLNVEPNTTKNFIPPPAPGVVAAIPPTTKAWRYAYDVNGELVGTSDARGCGSNYTYDAGGRVSIEDYSPCLAAQALYSAPNVSTGDGAEVFYHYDSPDPTAPTTIQDCTINGSLMLGRLASVSDRASKTLSSYDGRGRGVCGARQVAVPTSPGTSIDLLVSRYAPTWYTQTTSYDGADRPVQDSTGATVVVPAGGQSYVTTTYSKRGTVATVGSSYGPLLVTGVTRDADGSILQIGHGDAAGTTSAMTYDARRRLSTAQTYRGAPSLWSQQPAAYSPAPNPSGPPTTLQRLLADSDFHYDAVDNPIEIDDWRDPSEWPAGAQPVTRKMQYDDLYRLSQISYQYASGADAWTDPFAAEDNGTPAELDPRRAAPSPHLSFTNRVLLQTFQYDWLGNTTQTGDDAGGFYDRSLGAITNGNATAGPYQLQSATGGAAPRDGSLTTSYDPAGNVVGLSVERNAAAPCLPTSAPCSQFFAYDWDEVGRLVRARRWDGNSLGVASGPLPALATAVDLQYAYDGNDDRVLKTAVDASGDSLFTVYIADSLELRRTTFNGSDYVRDVWTEVPYLFANGERLARVHYATDDVPTLTSGNLHVLLEVQDVLGSTSIVLDQATSELVEDGTYEAYGATESDYRPARWDSYREDYRFTGKEEDVEVGLEYFGRRYYAPAMGRWASPDPAAVHEMAADPNMYAYVVGAVFRAVDPLGLADAPPPGSAENPIPTNQKPTDATTIDAGQLFTLLKPSADGKGGVSVFKTTEDAKRAGGQTFFRYEPKSSIDWQNAQGLANANHSLDSVWNEIYKKLGLDPEQTNPSGRETGGDLAQRLAHPLTEADPDGKSGGMVGGDCPSCKGNALVQVLEAALQVWETASSVKKVAGQIGEIVGAASQGFGNRTGSYTNTHASGKTYAGKGGTKRSQASGRRVEKAANDQHVATDWTEAPNDTEAFKDEARRIEKAGGPRNPNNYNKIESPGRKLLEKVDDL